MRYLNLKSLFMLDITQIKFCKYYQGVTKMVSTCPRQVVLISGQVGYQTYLSFGRVNPRVFASVKQITFHESNLQVRIEKKKNSTDASDLQFIRHFISLCTERGLGLLGG